MRLLATLLLFIGFSTHAQLSSPVAGGGPADTDALTEGSTHLYFTQARVIASPATGFTSGAGTVSASDTLLGAIQKLDGNVNTAVAHAEYDFGNSGSSISLSWLGRTNGKLTLTASCTISSFTNLVAGNYYTLKVVQGGSGSYTLAMPSGTKWVGAAPVLSTTVGAIDIISFYYDGTNYFASAGIGYN